MYRIVTGDYQVQVSSVSRFPPNLNFSVFHIFMSVWIFILVWIAPNAHFCQIHILYRTILPNTMQFLYVIFTNTHISSSHLMYDFFCTQYSTGELQCKIHRNVNFKRQRCFSSHVVLRGVNYAKYSVRRSSTIAYLHIKNSEQSNIRMF